MNHSKDESYRYDFSIIESDGLGNILKPTPKRAKLESSKTHRKEQGIYCTPAYIVDYIVENTVGEYIRTHSAGERKTKGINKSTLWYQKNMLSEGKVTKVYNRVRAKLS